MVGPRGRESVQLIGMDPNIVRLGVLAQREPVSQALLLAAGLGVCRPKWRDDRCRRGGAGDAARQRRSAPAPLDPCRAHRRARQRDHVRDGGDRAAAARAVAHGQSPDGSPKCWCSRSRAPKRLVAGELRRLAGGRLDVEPAPSTNCACSTARRSRPTSRPRCLPRSAGWWASCWPSTRCCSRSPSAGASSPICACRASTPARSC